MNARRLLFLQSQRPAGITPLTAALALVAFIGVMGLIVALWPRAALAHVAHLPVTGEAVPAACLFERGLQLPEAPAPAKRSRWT